MKLRLPHKFQTALMAALASVSITTLSSATAYAEETNAKTMHVYILTGQSNSLGAVKGEPLPTVIEDAYQSGVLLYNGNMHKDRPSGATTNRYIQNPEWQTVAPQEPGLTINPGGYGNNPCMGPEYGFAYMMEKKGWAGLVGENDALAVVKSSLDGGGNGYWLQTNYAYQTLLDTVKLSIQDAVALGYTKISLDGLMYLQGESNKNNEPNLAATRFRDFLGYLNSDLDSWLETEDLKGTVTLTFTGEHANAVTGEPATWTANNIEPATSASNVTAAQMIELATSDGKINADQNGYGFVYTQDLAKITSGDNQNVHYNGVSQLTIGARYAYAFAVQNGINVGTVRGQDDSKNLDDAAAWWMEQLPAPDAVAVWDLSSVSHSIAVPNCNNIATELTVGGIRIEDIYQPHATNLGQGTVAITGGSLNVGGSGIELQGGNLTVTTSNVATTANQTWKVAAGKTLQIGSADALVASFGGNHAISIGAQTPGQAAGMVKLNASTDGGHSFSIDDGAGLVVNASDSVWSGTNVSIRKSGSFGTVTDGDVTINSLTLDAGAVFDLGGGSNVGLHTGSLSLGGDATFRMNVDSVTAHDCLYLTSVTAASPSTVTFELTAGAGVRSGVGYVLAQGWDSSLLTAVSASDKAELTVDESNQLIATFSGIADYTKPWVEPTGDPLTIDSTTVVSSIYDAAKVHGHATEDSSSLTQGNTASGVYFFASNTDGNNGQVYAELKDASATWVVAAGHNGGSGYRNNMGGSYHVKVTGTQAVTYGGVYAVTNGTVQGDAYIELCNDAATYNGNTYGDAVNGIYNGTVEGSVTLLVRSGTFKDDITGGHFSATAGQHIGKGVFVQVDGGSVSGQVRGGGLNANGTINGGTHVLVNGGTFAHNVMGGGSNGTINDGTEVIIRGGTIQGDVMGGGTGGTINGDSHVTITGGTIQGDVMGGGTGGTITGRSSVTIEGNLATILGNISADTVTLQDISPNASGQQTVDKYHGSITADTVVLNKYNVERLLANLETKSLVLSGGTTTTIGNLTLTACDITVEEGSALTLENPVNLGYTTTYNGHVAIADGTLFNMQDAVMTGDISGYSEGLNGFAQGTLIVLNPLAEGNSLYTATGGVLTAENTATFSGSGILTGATFDYDAASGQLTAKAKGFGGPYYVNEGTVVYSSTSTESRVYTADDIRLNGGTLQFQEALKDGTALSVTKTGSGMVLAAGTTLNASIITYGQNVNGFDLSGEGELILTAANAEQILTNVTGDGTMHLVESAVLNGVGATAANPKASVSTGTFIVGNGAGSDQVQLQIGRTATSGGYQPNYANIKSFQHVTLDNGQLWFHTNNDNGALTVNGLTVTENGGSIYLQDVNGASTIKLAGTTNLQGDLTYTNNWKDNTLDVDKLTGSGDFSVAVNNNSLTLNLRDVSDWSGSLNQTKGTGTYNFGTSGSTVNFNGLSFEGSSAQVNLFTNSAAKNIHTNKLTLGSGMTLTAYYGSYDTTDNDGLATKLVADTLQLLGDATIKTTQHGGYMEFGSITGSGTLTIQHTASSTVRDTVSVGGNPDVASAFTGKLLINEDNTGGGRGIFVVLNDQLTMSQAQLELKAQNTGGTRYVGVGINADLVQLGALIDGDNVGNLTAYTLFSGDASGSPTAQKYSGYGSRGGMRTLEFTGADTYSTSIKVLNNISLAMSGIGSQSFTGDMSQFNGSIKVTNGTLNLTPSGAIATHAVTVGSAGTLNITTTGSNAINAFGTMVNEGNLSLTGTVALNSSDLSAYTVVAGTESNTKYSGTETYAGSGFLVSSAEYYLVKGNGTVSGTYNIDLNTGSIVEGKTDDHNVVVTFKTNPEGGLYYVNDDFTYNATEMGNASGFVIAKGATLTTNSVSDVTNKVLHGSGSYAALNRSDNGPWSAANGYGLGVGVSLGTDWTGTVVVSGGAGNKQMMNLDILGNNGHATVEIKGLVGWSQNWNGTIAANIKLTDVGSTVAWSNGASTSGSATATFTGRWSGEGTFKRTGTNNVNYTYIGDISEWGGKFDMNGGNTTLTFAGSANVVNATIERSNGTLNLVADTDVQFNKDITVTGFTNTSHTVTLGDGITLTMHALDAGQTQNLGNIVVEKSATIVDTNYHATMNFTTITGGENGTLTLLSSHSANTSEWNLGVAGQTQASPFSGKLVLMAERDGSKDRAANFNFVDGTMFSGAEVQIKNGTDVTNNTLTNTLNLKAANVTIGGLSDAAAGMVTDKRKWSVANGTDQGSATLTLNGSGTYTSDIKLEGGVNLVMNGEGTQTFSGDMSAFNGSLTVNDGTLAITGNNGISAAYITSDTSDGTLDVTGVLTLTGVQDSFDQYTYAGKLAVGGLHVDGGFHEIHGIDRLGSAIQVGDLGALALGAGTYNLSELAIDEDDLTVTPTGNGFMKTYSGTVQFATFVGGGYISPDDNLTFTHGEHTSGTLNAGTGEVTFAEYDYTTYYLREAGKAESLANAINTGKGQMTTVEMHAGTTLTADTTTAVNTLTIDADTAGTAAQVAGGTANFTKLTGEGEVDVANGATLNAANITVEVGKALTIGGEGTLGVTAINGAGSTTVNAAAVNGNLAISGSGTVVFGDGSDVSLTGLNISGDGTNVTFNEKVTVAGTVRPSIGFENPAATGATVTFSDGFNYTGTNGYALLVGNGNTVYLGGETTLANNRNTGMGASGKIVLQEGASFTTGRVINTSSDNTNNGTLEVRAGASFTAGAGGDNYVTTIDNAGSVTFVNRATVVNLTNSGTMTLNGLTMAEGATFTNSGTFTLGGAINIDASVGIANNGPMVVTCDSAQTLGSTISGTGSLTKDGTGTLTVSGDNTGYTGNISVVGGTLKVGHNNALGTLSGARTLTIQTGGTLDVNGKEGNAANNFVVELAGGTLANTASGLSYGTRQFVTSVNVTADSTIQADNVFGFTAGSYNAINVVFTDGTTLEKKGTADFVVTKATITGNGTFKVSQGALKFQHATTSSANFIMNGGTVAVGQQAAANYTLSRDIAITTTADSTFSLPLNTNAHAITYNGDANLAVSGAISGTGSLVKDGAGTLTLSGASTYTGGTTISAGTLVADNASALGSGNVTIGANGTLLVSENLTIKGDDTAGHKGIDNQGTVSIADGKTLSLYGLVSDKQYDLGTVNVLGTAATIENINHRGTISLGSVTGTAGSTVTLFSNHSSNPATWNLGTADSGSFAGDKLVLLVGDGTDSGGARTVSYNFNNSEMFGGKAVQLENAYVMKSKTMTNNVVLNAATVKMGGINDAAAGTVASNRVWSISKGSSAGERAKLVLDGNDANGYSTAVKVGAGIDIQKTGSATQVFSGDTRDFNGSIDVEAGVLNIMNAASVAVQDVTIGANGTLGVYKGTEATPSTTNEGTLTIQDTKTLTAGEGAHLNANLVMDSGSTLNVSSEGGIQGLIMGSTVTLNSGNTLKVDGSDANAFLLDYFGGSTTKLYTLFEGTAGDPLQLYIGNQKIETDITFESWDKPFMDASTIYTNLQAQTYYLVYDHTSSNVGMVAIGFAPEPTTGTLSLLALAALAARRRRK